MGAGAAHGGIVGGATETSGSLRLREGMHAEKIAAPHTRKGRVRVRGLCLPAFRRRMGPPSIGEPLRGKFPDAHGQVDGSGILHHPARQTPGIKQAGPAVVLHGRPSGTGAAQTPCVVQVPPPQNGPDTALQA